MSASRSWSSRCAGRMESRRAARPIRSACDSQRDLPGLVPLDPTSISAPCRADRGTVCLRGASRPALAVRLIGRPGPRPHRGTPVRRRQRRRSRASPCLSRPLGCGPASARTSCDSSGLSSVGPSRAVRCIGLVGEAGFEPTISYSQSTRVARLRYSPPIGAQEAYITPREPEHYQPTVLGRKTPWPSVTPCRFPNKQTSQLGANSRPTKDAQASTDPSWSRAHRTALCQIAVWLPRARLGTTIAVPPPPYSELKPVRRALGTMG